MTGRIVGGIALVWLAGFVVLECGQFEVSRAHAERREIYRRATERADRIRSAAPPDRANPTDRSP